MFANIIGHSQAKTILYNALSGDRVAHAYLFHGPKGIGKESLARAFAAILLCKADGKDACGKCTVCERLSKDVFPDFMVIKPSGNNIKIEQVREIQKRVQFKPYEAEKKICLINTADTMTREASNCILKILEDPPPDTVFLLTTINPYNMLPTIISRCQLIPLGKVHTNQIEEMLHERFQVDLEKAKFFASLSDGVPGTAIEMSTSDFGLEAREWVFKLEENLTKGTINELLKVAEELEKRKDLSDIFDQLLLWFRDRLIWLETGEDKLIINIDKLDLLKRYSNSKKYYIQSIIDIIEARNKINQNVNLRLIIEVLLLRLAGAA